MKPILAGMIVIAALASAVSGVQAQSFNCRRAYFADEKLICMSPDLSRLDDRLNRIFGENRRLLSPPGRNALDREEERWVIARRRCGPDHRCIEDFYRDRIAELADRLGNARGEARRDAWSDDRRDARGDDRDEPPVARSERWRDGPPPERSLSEPPSATRERWREAPPPEAFVPEPPRAESRRARPVATSRAQPDDSERLPRREAAPPPSTRYSSQEEEVTTRHAPPPASEKRQPAPVQAGAAAQSSTSAAATAPKPPRQPAAPQPANTAPPPEAATGNSMPAPRIEFSDPASGPMTPAR